MNIVFGFLCLLAAGLFAIPLGAGVGKPAWALFALGLAAYGIYHIVQGFRGQEARRRGLCPTTRANEKAVAPTVEPDRPIATPRLADSVSVLETALLDGAIILFGPHAKENAEELVAEELPGTILAVERAADIQLPEVDIRPCNLIFAHYIPGQEGRPLTEQAMRQWAATLLRGASFSPADFRDPDLSWCAGKASGNKIILNLFWQVISAKHVLRIAKKLEQSFLHNGGKYMAPARPVGTLALGASVLESQRIKIPAGPFLMGSTDDQAERFYEETTQSYLVSQAWFDRETPQRTVYLDEYEIDQYPITCAQYFGFCSSTGYPTPPYWKGDEFLLDWRIIPSSRCRCAMPWRTVSGQAAGFLMRRSGRRQPAAPMAAPGPGATSLIPPAAMSTSRVTNGERCRSMPTPRAPAPTVV
jgi:hypothetical protein